MGVGVHHRGFFVGSIEACMFNKRVAAKVSPDLKGYGLPECSFEMQTTIEFDCPESAFDGPLDLSSGLFVDVSP